jgi:hypothetical protein
MTDHSSAPLGHALPTSLEELVAQLQDHAVWVINPRRKNGLILYKKYHAEFAGPGAIIGSHFDEEVEQILPVGKLSLVVPKDTKEKVNAYLIRRQWVRLTQQITDNPVPLQRAQVILNQFENWFDADTVANLPDAAFAQLVGVLPETIHRFRHEPDVYDGSSF